MAASIGNSSLQFPESPNTELSVSFLDWVEVVDRALTNNHVLPRGGIVRDGDFNLTIFKRKPRRDGTGLGRIALTKVYLAIRVGYLVRFRRCIPGDIEFLSDDPCGGRCRGDDCWYPDITFHDGRKRST